MRRLLIGAIILLCGLSCSVAIAGEITQGTLSLGGSSSFSFSTRDYDKDAVDTSRSVVFDMNGGYFVMNNIEIALGVGIEREEREDDYEFNSYRFVPMINYYVPVTANTGFFAGIGLMWEKFEMEQNSYSHDGDALGFGAKAGFNIFMTQNAAISLEASYWRIEWDYDGALDGLNENRITIPQIGIKLFF